MNIRCIITIAAVSGLTSLVAGCGKKDQPAQAPAPAEQPVVQKVKKPAPPPAPAEAPKPAATLPTAPTQAQQAVTQLTNLAAPMTDTAKAQALIDSAKQLMAEGKYQEALPKFTALASMNPANFTPEQVQTLIEMKKELEKMVK